MESGSDDPVYLGHLGHFFGESCGSHPQTKLSGCDSDFNRSRVLWEKTLASDKQMNPGSGEYNEPSLA